ncbi:hypothetical protein [Melissospora conviva]|uniref:hypothetical protein n=1 Tax=Melissospora conviva TaxID=3388432 RepID=UPI003B825E59
MSTPAQPEENMTRRLTKKTFLAGLATAGVLGAGIAVPAVAMADDAADSGGTTATGEQSRDGRQEHAQKLADALGVDVAKVTEALDAVHEAERAERAAEKPADTDRAERLAERLAEAVEEGTLTQEQADAVTTAQEAGVLGHGHGKGHGHGHGHGEHHGERGDRPQTDQGGTGSQSGDESTGGSTTE